MRDRASDGGGGFRPPNTPAGMIGGDSLGNPMKVYHRTPYAPSILAAGFRASSGYYGLQTDGPLLGVFDSEASPKK